MGLTFCALTFCALTFGVQWVGSGGEALLSSSVEGRAYLHEQAKVLHDKYITYAHRVRGGGEGAGGDATTLTPADVILTSADIILTQAYLELLKHAERLRWQVESEEEMKRSLQTKLAEQRQRTGAVRLTVEEHTRVVAGLEERLEGVGRRQKEPPLTEKENEFKARLGKGGGGAGWGGWGGGWRSHR